MGRDAENEKELRRFVRRSLCVDFPVSKPVRLYMRRKIRCEDEVRGLIHETPRQFSIFVQWSSDYAAMLDVLIHEWAHARMWPSTDHDIRFDLELGHINRRYFGD